MLKRITLALLGAALLAAPLRAATLELLNVSYDPTRELWRDVNAAFVPKYEKETGTTLSIKQSHGGSGTAGARGDRRSRGRRGDARALAGHRCHPQGGADLGGLGEAAPQQLAPYTSTAVFVVRKGNPKGIKDWPDLIQPGIEIVTPNPKTSGNGKVSFLAAWGSVTQRGGSEAEALEFVKKLYEHVPVLDLGARGSTTTFVQKKIGDVHLAWENEAHLEVQEAGGEVEIVNPPISFLAEPPVTWVDANVKRKHTEAAAKAYLEFLYTDEGQAIIAKNFYRPITPPCARGTRPNFPTSSSSR